MKSGKFKLSVKSTRLVPTKSPRPVFTNGVVCAEKPKTKILRIYTKCGLKPRPELIQKELEEKGYLAWK